MTEEEPAIHPGKFLAEILAEEKLTQAQFARVIGVSAMRVSHVPPGFGQTSLSSASIMQISRSKRLQTGAAK